MEQTPQQRPDSKALVAAVATFVLWASAFVAIRVAVQDYSPGALALGRLLSGSLVLVAILLIRREGLPPRAAWPGILISGILWFGVYTVALNAGEQAVDAGTASLILGLGPVLIAVLGGWILKEGFPRRLVAGVVISFTGAAVVGLSMSGHGSASLAGVLLCVLAAVSWAVATLAQKPALQHASALQVTAYGCLVGTVACLPFAGQLVEQLAKAPLTATLNVVYLGVFPTALAFTAWAYALARTPAGTLGASSYLVPALTVLMSWAVLGEVPGWLTFAGGLLCLGGVAVTRSRRLTFGRRESAPREVPR
ncbi:DMT family transporter [Nonomuraea longicatena]|uniref:DMT family transporter n=1 Tax=Nonomuraea longicatena TaxID=83682 RepID=A0ABP4BL26_9ACTN